jgi:BrnA antitoxin of type II toxin-antitoxin system
MKRASSSHKFTAKQIREAIAAAPTTVAPSSAAYDPNDAKAVSRFWKGAVVTPGGGVAAVTAALAARRKPGQRGPGKRPPKVAAFKATGDGWQTKVDGALREWLKDHSPA